ncbi:MAG TPA: hypothetical protein VD788_09240, partial [Candidatus Polarisedimenticolaceae bacterium]|nr:hypothetical protein [Candidatus Polarisedimenticolaceae bacterium]
MGRIATVALTLVLAAPAGAAVAPDDPRPDPRERRPALARVESERLALVPGDGRARAADRFRARYGGDWSFAYDRRSDHPALIQGAGIPLVPGRGNRLGGGARAGERVTLDTLAAEVRRLLAANGPLLVPAAGRLELDRAASSIREQGRLASLLFRWSVGGVPVERAHVFVRINSGNVTQLGAPLVGRLTEDPVPAIDRERAIELLMRHSGDGEIYRMREAPALVFQPEEHDGRLDYRLVWKMSYRVLGRIETWEGRVDAHT